MHPVIGDEAAAQLREEYLRMRSQGAKAAVGNVVTATPRQLESMIRLSEALAKMLMTKDASGNIRMKRVWRNLLEDVKEAARLINVATQRVVVERVVKGRRRRIRGRVLSTCRTYSGVEREAPSLSQTNITTNTMYFCDPVSNKHTMELKIKATPPILILRRYQSCWQRP